VIRLNLYRLDVKERETSAYKAGRTYLFSLLIPRIPEAYIPLTTIWGILLKPTEASFSLTIPPGTPLRPPETYLSLTVPRVLSRLPVYYESQACQDVAYRLGV
jgi:hypothetical protein